MRPIISQRNVIFKPELGRKIRRIFLFFFISVIVFSFVLGFLRQVAVQGQLNRRLNQKRAELEHLEEENKRLSEKLKETEKPEFVEEQAALLFGMSKDGEPIVIPEGEEKKSENIPQERKISNYQKWLRLFWD